MQFFNHGIDACDFDEDIRSHPAVMIRGDGGALNGTPNTGCTNWQRQWADWVKTDHPSVVGMLMGRVKSTITSI